MNIFQNTDTHQHGNRVVNFRKNEGGGFSSLKGTLLWVFIPSELA